MKKIITPSTALMLFLCVTVFSGCQKIYDRIVKHPGGEIKKCRIASISQQYEGAYGIMRFTYNQHGDPTLIAETLEFPEGGGRVYYYEFYYDNHKRLIEMRDYGNPEEPNIRRFGYNANDQIVTDSFFNWSPHEGYLTELTYDRLGRISHTITTYLYSGAGETGVIGMRDFDYDVNGNLLPEQGSTDVFDYDDQLIYLRTNWIWMFLNRDYSVNNRYPATGYNEYHLPTGFDRPVGSFLAGADDPQITYDCRGK